MGGHTDSVKIDIVRVFNFFSFTMSDAEALLGASEAHLVAVADRSQGLDHQLAWLTQMVQTRETVGIEEWQSVKNAVAALIINSSVL